MSDWSYRISPSQAAEILGSAVDGGFIGTQRAVMLHDVGSMQRRIAALQSAFPSNALHAIAIKANPLVNVLRAVVEAGAGLEAASWEEVQLARHAGCPPSRIVFDSPAKTVHELEAALQAGIGINADNYAELERLAAILTTRTSNSRIGLRVNTQVGTGGIASTSVAGTWSKFGVPLDDEESIQQAFARYPWLRGLHAHVGSQGCDPESLVASAAKLLELRQRIHARLREDRIAIVDIGGGLPVRYRPQDQPIGLDTYVQRLQSQAPGLFDDKLQLVTEFGRAVQAGCGVALSRVEYVKRSEKLAVVHFGADLLLRWVYHPHDWHHSLFVLDAQGHPKAGPLHPISIVGPLCFGGDVLQRECMLPEVEPDDWIGFSDVGAYTLSMWSRHCSRALPLVLGFDGATSPQLTVLKPAESAEDVVRFWS